MPIISTSYLLATLATQAASALFNAKRGKKYSEELAKKQQEYEERVLTEGIENARAEFAEMCALQRELELEMQQDRLQMIRDSLKSNIMLEAYRHSLKDWPLLVPPFVIKNEYLPVLEFEEREQNHTIPVNCIMTTSSDTKFNLKIFTLLEEKLALFFSKHWRGDKAIRFYQQAWRNNVTDIGAMMHDIKAHLSEVPTIVLSPMFVDDKLKFAFSWWGMSNKIEDEHIVDPDNVFDPELSVEIRPGMDYDEKTIEIIINELFNKLAAFISYFADLYYWNFYKIAPSLPVLIGNDMITLSKNDRQSYKDEYKNQLLEYCKEQDCIINSALVSEQLFVSMSNIVDKSTIAKGVIDYIETKRNNNVLNWCELRLLNTIKEIVNDRSQNSLQKEFHIITETTNDLLKQNSSLDKCIEHYAYLSLGNLALKAKDLFESNDIIYFEFEYNKLVVSIYAESSFVLVDGTKCYERYNYRIDCLLVPFELSQKRVKRIKINRDNIDAFNESIVGECRYNLFFKTLDLNDIISYCNSLEYKVLRCELVKGKELGTIMTNVGEWELQHIVHCNIKQSHCSTSRVFYYDCLGDKLMQMFEDANHLIIE